MIRKRQYVTYKVNQAACLLIFFKGKENKEAEQPDTRHAMERTSNNLKDKNVETTTPVLSAPDRKGPTFEHPLSEQLDEGGSSGTGKVIFCLVKDGYVILLT